MRLRRRSLVAWAALGLGILIGARWAYLEAAWGGFWTWDPVENASLVPWLAGTALLHAVAPWERRGVFRTSAAALAIGTFLLCMLGTLIARADPLGGSLHSFAPSQAGYLVGAYLVVATVACTWLLVRRRRELHGAEAVEQALSREGAILVGNLLFVGLALAILLGTLSPVFTQTLWGERITLGGAFFERVSRPLALAGLLLLGLAPLLSWRRTEAETLRLALVPVGAGLGTWLVLAVMRRSSGPAALAFAVIAFAAAGSVQELVRTVSAWQQLGSVAPWAVEAGHLRTHRRRYAMLIAHLGAAVLSAGIVGQGLYRVEREVTLQRGEAVTVGPYEVRFEALSSEMLPAKERHVATVGVYAGERRIATLRPEYNYHHSVRDYVAEVALRSTLRDDLYVAVAGIAEGASSATFRVRLHPLMLWLWVGGAAILPAVALAVWPAEHPALRAAAAGGVRRR
jgi:cytochrome c-type biogenesis protein CcmF